MKLRDKVSKRVQILCNDEPRTKQCFKDQTDINKIVARFTRMSDDDVRKNLGNPLKGFYDDFSDVVDLRTMYERIAAAESSFYALPAKVRKDFDNDALRFMEFVQDPKNVGKMREYGLIKEDVSVASDSPPVAQKA